MLLGAKPASPCKPLQFRAFLCPITKQSPNILAPERAGRAPRRICGSHAHLAWFLSTGPPMHQYAPEIARKHQNQTFAKHVGGRRGPDEGCFKSGGENCLRSPPPISKDRTPPPGPSSSACPVPRREKGWKEWPWVTWYLVGFECRGALGFTDGMGPRSVGAIRIL